eukprot:510007_1
MDVTTFDTHEANDVQQYLIKQIGGYCKIENCPILHHHFTRRRENNEQAKDVKRSDTDNNLKEILSATLNALHCYVVHETKQLFRYSTSHFITSVIDEAEIEAVDDKKTNAVSSIKFGVNVLKWFKYGDPGPRFDNFHDEIVNNPESTINEKLFLNFSVECYIKLNQCKYEQFTLN